MASKKVIGVLALQGDFREHIHKLRELGAEVREIRRAAELGGLDALVLPGGESTAVAIIESAESGFSKDSTQGMFEAIRAKGLDGLPIWGTCMGSILLAKEIEGSTQGRLALMNIKVRRNAFGPQRYSAETPLQIPAIGTAPFPGVFIRAPLIVSVGAEVEVLSRVEEGIVMAREGHLLATVFHPEVLDDLRVHEYFLGMIP